MPHCQRNYSWLNWLTAILGLAGLSDRILATVIPVRVPQLLPSPLGFSVLIYLVSAAAVLLSIQPVLNLFSSQQRMNFSYNRFHLVNTYGAFGSVGRERFEIVMEGTTERVLTPETQWKEYAFKAKPGDLKRRPPQIAPYHLRLDWLIWFLPFSVAVTPGGIRVRGYDRWFIRFVQKLLAGDAAVLSLMGPNPFVEQPPVFLRALFYRYRYTDRQAKAETGAWWTRELLGVYFPSVSLEMLEEG